MTISDRYAVIGNPVAHSKSPRIHALFAEQTGEALTYEAIEAPTDGFAEAVARFQREGGRGLNVTVPFKGEAWELADERAGRAERARAVNTLALQPDGRRVGHNTDGVGLVRDLTANHGAVLSDMRILLVGAGGAARGVVEPLLAEVPREVFVANRTAERAVALARDFADLGPVTGGGFDTLDARRYDLVINASAASLHGKVPPLPDDVLADGAIGYDMMYADEPTAFLRWAQAHGAALALDGLGMLVEQAAESFHIWRAVRPDTAPVIHILRPGS